MQIMVYNPHNQITHGQLRYQHKLRDTIITSSYSCICHETMYVPMDIVSSETMCIINSCEYTLARYLLFIYPHRKHTESTKISCSRVITQTKSLPSQPKTPTQRDNNSNPSTLNSSLTKFRAIHDQRAYSTRECFSKSLSYIMSKNDKPPSHIPQSLVFSRKLLSNSIAYSQNYCSRQVYTYSLNHNIVKNHDDTLLVAPYISQPQ